MAQIALNGASLGTVLTDILMADDIQPGAMPSYEVCKQIYLFHPIGRKLVEAPITLAQSQAREIEVQDGPEDKVKQAFLDEWKAIGADRNIFNTVRTKRIYGISSVAIKTRSERPDQPLDLAKLAIADVTFNVLDPLNTSGSLVLNQDPNAFDFQKVAGAVTVQGTKYHPSRCCVVLNEEPIYISFTGSAFGYVGRSAYQRALFPLKSFINSMVTDDMVVRKAGLLIAKMKQPGSIIDQMMTKLAGVKRQLLKEAQTNNVMSIDVDEDVETLNMQNLDGAYGMARKDILENIAVSDDMPAQLLNSEALAQGFADGSEDAKMIARYVERFREEMDPLYGFFDLIVQHRAWSPDFYESVKKLYPEYRQIDYVEALVRWQRSFKAKWPSFLIEPESELVKVDDVRLRAVIALLEVLLPNLDPENKAIIIEWACDNFNELKMMFGSPLTLDIEALKDYVPPVPGMGAGEEGDDGEEGEQKPVPTGDKMKKADSATVRGLIESVARLPDRRAQARRLVDSHPGFRR